MMVFNFSVDIGGSCGFLVDVHFILLSFYVLSFLVFLRALVVFSIFLDLARSCSKIEFSLVFHSEELLLHNLESLLTRCE